MLMKICLSFDDGRDDQYFNAYKMLKNHNLIGTFHVTTGFIDGSFVNECFGNNRKPLTINQLLEMHDNGMEISSHGDKHITNYNDFHISISKLKSWGIYKTRYGFSVPNSEYTKDTIDLFKTELKDTILYIRVGRNPRCYSFVNKIRFVLYHKLHFSKAFNSFNKNNLLPFDKGHTFYSLVVRSSTRVKDLINFIDKHSLSEYNLVIMFHSIVDKSTNKWEWNKSEFKVLCDYLESKKDILVVTTLEKMCKI